MGDSVFPLSDTVLIGSGESLDDAATGSEDTTVKRVLAAIPADATKAGLAHLARDLESDTLSGLLTCNSPTPSLGSTGGGAGGAVRSGQYASVAEPSLAVDDCTVDAEFLDSIARYNDDVDNFDAQAFARRYNELDGENPEQFRELAKNDEYGQSWIRVVDNRKISTSDVRTALDRTDNLESNGHQVRRFYSANELNENFRGRPPHVEDTIVIEADAQGQDTLYRLYDPDGTADGEWLFRRSLLDSADTDDDLIDALALLPNDWNRDYTSVSRLDTSEVPESTDAQVRVSTAGEMASMTTGEIRSGKATQYRLTGDDVENGWEPAGDLSEYVEVD